MFSITIAGIDEFSIAERRIKWLIGLINFLLSIVRKQKSYRFDAIALL